jgi:mRNA interferase MazF
MKRGDVVVVDFPYADGSASKVRPALVVQSDRDNARLRDTIIALITGNISRSQEPTQLLVDPNTTDGVSSGLHGPSCVLGSHLYTLRQSLVMSTIGHLSDPLMDKIDDCLRAALDVQP